MNTSIINPKIIHITINFIYDNKSDYTLYIVIFKYIIVCIILIVFQLSVSIIYF